MRRLSASCLLLALLPAISRGGPAGLVVQLAAPPATAALARASAAAIARERFASRLAALGLTLDRGLLDGLPAPRATAPATNAPRTHGLASRLAAFAPERVVLLGAADAASAERARLALADDAAVDWVEPLFTRTLQDVGISAPAARLAGPVSSATLDSLPNDPLFRAGKQYGLYNLGPGDFYGGVLRADVHAPEAWALSTGGDVLLAYADTGIDPDQPELAGLLSDGRTRIAFPLNVTGEPVPTVRDSFGHGTPVAGVMAARTNDGAHFAAGGVAGVCGGDGVTNAGCRLMPIKIAPGHSGEATSFDIARAAIAAADAGARTMNLSFAGDGSSRIERDALTYALLHGCVVVAAAGNKGAVDPTAPQYPAAWAAFGLCVQVGASDSFDERVGFSSYGPGLDFVAPGVNIWTTFMTYPSYYGAVYDGVVAGSGTSFAAPFGAGAIGLLAAYRPELGDTDFQHVLRESADDIGAPGVDAETGWGRLNIARALDAVRPGIGIWHDEVAADSLVADSTGTLLVGERGPGTLDHYRGQVLATRYAVLKTVTLPDSFAIDARVWPRVGGTWSSRGDFTLPFFSPLAEVVARNGRTFTLRGWLYRAVNDVCDTCADAWIPLPPEYMRFGFTVLGPVSAGSPRADVPPAPFSPLRAGPNPFRDALEVSGPSGVLDVLDVSGRVVRTLDARDGRARWDGRDRTGGGAAPGLYFVRWRGAAGVRTLRVIKLAG